ncbi:hypothetical protein J5N97_007196 [Dioscorea zingiberensis]|uniref:Uncharacterized protein n=1 Tax=Dioscorea zingiberensis TaxID=325984 RepID=A0A9D5DDG9_9LILI|nr:hypothetical protein J5N97_007196 [Dioscorea zingiberensis]
MFDPGAVLFGGFLTIGTLGSVPMSENSSGSGEDEDEEIPNGVMTPTFGVPSVDAIAEKGAEATTETDLMVVSAEIEKVLAAEAEKGVSGGGARISSARASYASAKSVAESCPLQGFLFGSPIEVAETRRERRASLGELFLKSKMEEETVPGGEGRVAASAAGGKKAVKRRSSAKATDLGGAPDGSSPAETKFHKILQIFHRKVHPESTLTTKKSFKAIRQDIRENSLREGGDNSGIISGDQTLTDSKRACKRMAIPCFKCDSSSPSVMVDGNDPYGNREYWIKTDADYLVLEL